MLYAYSVVGMYCFGGIVTNPSNFHPQVCALARLALRVAPPAGVNGDVGD